MGVQWTSVDFAHCIRLSFVPLHRTTFPPPPAHLAPVGTSPGPAVRTLLPVCHGNGLQMSGDPDRSMGARMRGLLLEPSRSDTRFVLGLPGCEDLNGRLPEQLVLPVGEPALDETGTEKNGRGREGDQDLGALSEPLGPSSRQRGLSS